MDGCVRLTWTAVSGAKTYVLGRSQGTNGFQRVPSPPAVGSTTYEDANVRTGLRVSYTVTAVDSEGLAGLRGVSPDFIPAAAPAAGCSDSHIMLETRPMNVVAERTATGFALSWAAAPLKRDGFEIRHFVNGHQVESQRVGGQVFQANFQGAVAGEHRFDVSPIDLHSIGGPSASSNIVAVAASQPPGGGSASPGLGGGSASPGLGAASFPTSGTDLSFAVAPPLSMGVGASSSPGAPSGSQWSSLDPGVASVTADGVVTARAAGEARIVAVAPAGGNGVRVTVVRVVVTP
jgi:hypothetical protein